MSVTLDGVPPWLGVAVIVALGVGAWLVGVALFSRDPVRRAGAERLLRTWLPWGGRGGLDPADDDADSGSP